MENADLAKLREAERVEEIRGTIKVISNRMVLPLYFVFWICDILYVPERKWTFLALRMLVLPVLYFVRKLLPLTSSYQRIQMIATAYTFSIAVIINIMMWIIKDPVSPYYAGLNLVAIGSLSFIPYNVRFYWWTVTAIYLPYAVLVTTLNDQIHSPAVLTMNTFFMMGTIVISFGIRYFNEVLRKKELSSRVQLKEELDNRDLIIKQKTQEAVQFSALNKQFSPQVVEGIRKGQIEIDGNVKRAKIAALFFDIVGSTDRVVKLDREIFDTVLKRFMEESYGTLLKYDLTIDKFLGDGVLAFCNEPVKRPDFIQRTCFAAFEIKSRLNADSEWFERHWKKKFEIRAGISVGYANVGFHGSDRYHKSYTAIGRPIAMAARLCSVAEPDQIVLDSEVNDPIESEGFKTTFLGKRTIRGFDGEISHVYRLDSVPSENFVNTGALECPACKEKSLMLEEENGIYYMKCRSCEHVLKAA